MTFSRIILLLVAIMVCFMVSETKAQDPPLYCSVFSFQPFSVVVGVSPDPDHLGSALAPEVQTTYGTTIYYVTLASQVTNNRLFLDLNNSQNGNVTFSVRWGLLAAGNVIVNNQYILDPTTGLAKIYYFNNSGWQVELSPFSSGGVNNRTFVVTVNLTQILYGPTGLDGSVARLDGCVYTNYFFITNPANSSNPEGLGEGSSSSTGSAIVGDPLFVGLRGQTFQVHGIDGAVYNLISDKDIQLNSRFVFLNGPRVCPIMPSTQKPSSACWSHPGSYLGELGLKTARGDRLFVAAGAAGTGFASVTLNGNTIKVGAELSLHDDLMTFNSTHELTFTAGHFTVIVENVDGFLNLRSVSVNSWKSLSSHGLLGQTWSTKKYSGQVKEIQGEVDDYVILSDNIFGDEFLFNKFLVLEA